MFIEALGVWQVEVKTARHSHHTFSLPSSVAHHEFADQVRVVVRPLRPQRLLRIRSQNDDVVVRRAVNDEVNVVNAPQVRSTIPTRICVSSNRAYIPASPAEVTPKRSAVRNQVHMAYAQAVAEYDCSCAPTFWVRLSFPQMTTLKYA